MLIKNLLRALNFKLLGILWTLTILFLSFLPNKTFPKVEIWSPDKLVHIFIYMVLSILFGISIYQDQQKINRKLFIIYILCCISFGWLIEIFQPILTDRYYEFYDIVANTVGVIIGSTIVNLLFNQR
jgi:VanZ family protein